MRGLGPCGVDSTSALSTQLGVEALVDERKICILEVVDSSSTYSTLYGRLAQRQSTCLTCKGSGFQNPHLLQKSLQLINTSYGIDKDIAAEFIRGYSVPAVVAQRQSVALPMLRLRFQNSSTALLLLSSNGLGRHPFTV